MQLPKNNIGNNYCILVTEWSKQRKQATLAPTATTSKKHI